MTTLLNRTDDRTDELVLIRSEPISMQWTNELRRSLGLHPSCKLLRELLSLDLYTLTVVYPLLIKGWSSVGSPIAGRFPLSQFESYWKSVESNSRESWQRPVRTGTLSRNRTSKYSRSCDQDAAELREKVVGLDKALQGFATGLDQLTHWYLGLAGLVGW